MPNSGKIATILGNVLTDSQIDLSTKADLVDGKIPSSQLPSYVDDILEYANLAAFPATGSSGIIYVAQDTNKIYRWTGSAYAEVSPTVGTTWGTITGTLSNQTDLQTALDAKVPTSRTLTINGTALDLSANRSFTVGDVRTDSTYANPAWITSLAYSKITGVPAFLTAESDTLDNVTGRGNTTLNTIQVGTTITAKGNTSGNGGSRLQLLGWFGASKNWQIDTAFNSSINELAFSPSTTDGGSTFTTPVIKFTTSGGATFNGGISATTGIFGGGSSATSQVDITSNASANGITLRNRSGDDYAFFNWRTYGGSELLAEQYIQRTAANTAVMKYTIANGSTPSLYLTIAATGAATFDNTLRALRVGVGSAPSATRPLRVVQSTGDEWIAEFISTGTNPYGIYIDTSANTSAVSSFRIYSNSGGLVFNNNGRLGINTPSPSVPLHVIGDTIFSSSSTQPFIVYGDSALTNGLFRVQIDEVNDSFGSGARTFLGDGGIDIFIGTGNSSYTPANTYIALNHSGEISMGAGSGTKHVQLLTAGIFQVNTRVYNAINLAGSSGATNPMGVFVNDYPSGDATKYYAHFGGNWASSNNWGIGVKGAGDNTIYLSAASGGVIDVTRTDIVFRIGAYNAWHAGNLTNLNQLTNGPGYITGNQTITLTGDVTGSGSTSISTTVNAYFDQRVYTRADNYLGGYYVSGGTEKPNDTIFGGGKLKVAMLAGSNLGYGGSWNDVLWISTYSGGDVKSSHALVFDKYSTDVWVSDQNFDSATWGTGYKLWHTGNLTNLNQLTNGPGYITSSATISGASGALSSRDNRVIAPNEDNAAQLKFGFTAWNNNDAPGWADYLHLRSYSDNSGGSDNLIMFSKNGFGMRQWQQTFGSATAYSSYVDYLHSSNYSSYALPLSGGTMTGDITLSGSGRGIYFTGGNNRIYFAGNRAIEGNGTNLQIGEGHSQTQIQSATLKIDGMIQLPGAGTNNRSEISVGTVPSWGVTGKTFMTDEVANYGVNNLGIILQCGYDNGGDVGGIKITDDGVIIWGAGDEDLFRIYNEDTNVLTMRISDGDQTFFAGDVTAYSSDRRLKTNIKPIDSPLEKIKQLQGITYDWNDVGEKYGFKPTKIREVGVFAQDVEAVLPEAVRPAPFDLDSEHNSISGENYLTVKYEKIVPLLIEAVKELAAENNKLKEILERNNIQ